MLNARMADELTRKAIEEAIATRQARAEEFCNNLDESITKACESRMNCLTVKEIPSELRAYILAILKDNSYRVTELNGNTVQISW